MGRSFRSPATLLEQEKELHFHQACEHATADLHQTHRLQRLIHRAEKDAPPGASARTPRTVTLKFNCIRMFFDDWYDVFRGTISSRHLSQLFSCFSTHRCVPLVFTPCSHLCQSAAAFSGTSAFGNVDRVSREQTKIKIVSSNLLGGHSVTYVFWIWIYCFLQISLLLMMICCGTFRRTLTVTYRNIQKYSKPSISCASSLWGAVGALLFGRGQLALG